jgi:outer membrane protein OmpA-like peptidoglycan-associated protein
VDGEEKKADYMAKGENLGLYLPPDRWEIVWSLETATPLDTQVYIEDIDTQLVTSNLLADEAFAFNSAELSVEGRAELDGIVTLIGNHVPAITIFGYTDRIGDEKYNQDLSQKRAESTRDYLVSAGVPSGRVTAIGRGESNPIVACEEMGGDELKACLLPNRRVEVVFFIPAIADTAIVEMTKTYLKPSGKIIQVKEELAIVKIEDISGVAGQFMDACAVEIENYCATTPAGEGRILGCLAANKQAGYEYSAGCDGELVRFVDAVLFKRMRLNAVGSECSVEIAACDAVPMGSKLDCVSSRPMSSSCSTAMSNLASAAF